MRRYDDLPDDLKGVMALVIAPGKPDGTCLRPQDCTPAIWRKLQPLFAAGDIFGSRGGRDTYIVPAAKVSELAALGYGAFLK